MFRLLRYFPITSLILIVAAALVLGELSRRIAVNNVMQMGERNNIALTGALSNILRPEFEPLVKAHADNPQNDNRLINRLHASVLEHTRGLSVVKVKIYDLRGKTVYSSEARQIGEDKSENLGFKTALAGRPTSEITHRDRFSAFEQVISDRDLISSYIPLTDASTSKVYAVFEIYDDVTPLMRQVADTRTQVMVGVTLILAFLYAVLFLIVLRADRIIRAHHERQLRHEQELQTAHDLLEQRVLERTAQLEQSNAQLMTEIDERRRTALQLIEAKHLADEASKAKSQFLANMSHEIRTPMNGVIGMTDLLLVRGKLDEEQRDCAQTIRQSADALMSVIDDILDISKIEAGKMELDQVAFDLPGLVSQVVDLHKPKAQARGLQVNCVIPANLPRRVRGDAGRLRQVLNNLISNAIKFTESGSVGVRVATQRIGERYQVENHVFLSFEVSDTGIGIEPDVRRRLFVPFTQGDTAFSRTYGGTGLGLAISKKLVEMMGGDIGVESKPGAGSKFWFTVGLECAEPSRPMDAADAPAQNGMPFARGARVLLAEDDPVNQTVAIEMLKMFGFDSVVVANGREVLTALETADYDMVLMDCHMPVMDGFAATAAIRSREAKAAASGIAPARRLPVIAFTANAMQGDRERCLAAGMDDYLTKPFRMETLRTILQRWMPDSPGLRQAA